MSFIKTASSLAKCATCGGCNHSSSAKNTCCCPIITITQNRRQRTPEPTPIPCDLLPVVFDITFDGHFPFVPPATITLVNSDGPTLRNMIQASAGNEQFVVTGGPYIVTDTINILANNIWVVASPANRTVTIRTVDNVVVRSSFLANAVIGFRLEGFSIVNATTAPGQGRAANIIRIHNGATAEIENNDIGYDPAIPISGATQSGSGVLVERVGVGEAEAFAWVRNNTIHDIQKTGVVVSRAGSFGCGIFIDNNMILGNGPDTIIATNGIQVSRQSQALVQNNFVDNFSYTGAQPVYASGIIVFAQSGNAFVVNNVVQHCDLGIPVFGNNLVQPGVGGPVFDVLVQQNNVGYGSAIVKPGVSGSGIGALGAQDFCFDNTFSQNLALFNPEFDLRDNTIGPLSAGTANIWLCNQALIDNRGGALIASTSAHSSAFIDFPFTPFVDIVSME